MGKEKGSEADTEAMLGGNAKKKEKESIHGKGLLGSGPSLLVALFAPEMRKRDGGSGSSC